MRHAAQLVLVLIVCAAASSTSWGCTLGLPSLKGFDPAEYVFTGEVTGVVGPFESKGFEGRSWGLKVRVEDAIHLPARPRDHFEVFRYNLRSDCSMAGASEDALKKYFPVGSHVKLIAKEAKLLPGRLDDGDLRLEVLPDSLGSISMNSYEDGRMMSDAAAVFDYRSYKEITPADYVRDFMPFLDARVLLPQFELRKDLLRLRGANSRAERIAVLERLVYYPACCDLDFTKIARQHLGKSKEFRTLLKKREQWDARYSSSEKN